MGNALLRECLIQPDQDPRFSIVTIGLSGGGGTIDMSWTTRVFKEGSTREAIDAAIYEAIIWLGSIRYDEDWLESVKTGNDLIVVKERSEP